MFKLVQDISKRQREMTQHGDEKEAKMVHPQGAFMGRFFRFLLDAIFEFLLDDVLAFWGFDYMVLDGI